MQWNYFSRKYNISQFKHYVKQWCKLHRKERKRVEAKITKHKTTMKLETSRVKIEYLLAPKSASLMVPLLSTRMFAPWQWIKEQIIYSSGKEKRERNQGPFSLYSINDWKRKGTLMSLCIISLLCKYSRNNNNCFVYVLITC